MDADNQQETLENFYYTGFCAGEMYCGLMKLSHSKGGSGFYFTPDLTVANANIDILKKLNTSVFLDSGIISPIKGGYNLKIRGWKKVKAALLFFQKFPPLKNSILWHKINLLKEAFKVFKKRKGNQRSAESTSKFEEIISRFKAPKTTAEIIGQVEFPSKEILGHFFAGLFDAEGSMGLKKHRDYYQPFFVLAMRDKYLVHLLNQFIGSGNIYFRPHQNIYHYETAKVSNVREVLKLFSQNFPLRLPKNIERLSKLQRILNDHTRGSKILPIYYDGNLW